MARRTLKRMKKTMRRKLQRKRWNAHAGAACVISVQNCVGSNASSWSQREQREGEGRGREREWRERRREGVRGREGEMERVSAGEAARAQEMGSAEWAGK
eukprot:2213596-Rhodomonas_salina.1